MSCCFHSRVGTCKRTSGYSSTLCVLTATVVVGVFFGPRRPCSHACSPPLRTPEGLAAITGLRGGQGSSCDNSNTSGANSRLWKTRVNRHKGGFCLHGPAWKQRNERETHGAATHTNTAGSPVMRSTVCHTMAVTSDLRPAWPQ